MSITGISAASSAIYTLQPQNAASAGTTTPAATPQTAAPANPATQTDPTQQPDQVHHHHHHHGAGGAAPPSDLTQAGTAATNGTNILNTLV
jgi:hypothetical protein